MNLDDMLAAVRQARDTLSGVDGVAHALSKLLVGRLRHCDEYELKQLKRELRNFNIHTGRWK